VQWVNKYTYFFKDGQYSRFCSACVCWYIHLQCNAKT
jgi:hypothetical protein